jgi:hypothetical protein
MLVSLKSSALCAVVLSTLACGGPATKAQEGPPDSGHVEMTDAGVALECPTGYTLGSTVNLIWNNVTAGVGCWQATIEANQVVKVNALPNYELGPDQLSLTFNSNDAADNNCAFATGTTIPLTSSCVVIEGSNVTQWYTFSNIPAAGVSPTGSITITAWPSAPGQPVSVMFSSDATLVVHAQNGSPTVDSPIVGSFQVNAISSSQG